MSNLNKVVLCLEKIKSKICGQNPDNLRHFFMKNFNYDREEAMKLINEAIVANIIKSVIFNGKVAFRIIGADPNADIRLLYQKRKKIILMLSRVMLLKTETVAKKLVLLKTVRLPRMTNRLVIY